jgi:hypothetical protein
MTKLKTAVSVASILERELEPTIKDWLRRVNEVPALTKVPLSDADRTGHLPKFYFDLICRVEGGGLEHSRLPNEHAGGVALRTPYFSVRRSGDGGGRRRIPSKAQACLAFSLVSGPKQVVDLQRTSP